MKSNVKKVAYFVIFYGIFLLVYSCILPFFFSDLPYDSILEWFFLFPAGFVYGWSYAYSYYKKHGSFD